MSGLPGNVNTPVDVKGTLYVATYNGSKDVWPYVVPSPPPLSFFNVTTPVSDADPVATVSTDPAGTVGQFFFEVLYSTGSVSKGSGA